MLKVEALSGKGTPVQEERTFLGSTFQISLFAGADYKSLMASAFHAAEELEKIVNVHDPESEISRLVDLAGDDTLELTPALADILSFAEQAFDVSEGAFNPWREGSDFGDFTGIAHAFLVDRMIDVLQMARPGVAGFIRVEGMLRFFNRTDRNVIVHLDSGKTAKISLTRDAVVFTEQDVFIEADDCVIAEAMGTIALFARPTIVEKSLKFFNAKMMELDEQGQPYEETSTMLRHAH